jgi:hypothetical protein
MMCDSGPCHTVLMMRFHTVHSLANNSICREGNMEGLNAFIEALKQMPQLVSLKCVSSRTPTARFAMMCDSGHCHISETTRRAHSRPFAHSLAGNNLTNLGRDMSGVKALAAALKDSQIVNLK